MIYGGLQKVNLNKLQQVKVIIFIYFIYFIQKTKLEVIRETRVEKCFKRGDVCIIVMIVTTYKIKCWNFQANYINVWMQYNYHFISDIRYLELIISY